jgi:hypothetical protein
MCDLDPYLVRREKIAVLKAQAGELPDADLMLAATHELIKLFSSQRRPISAEIREIHITTQKLH